MHEFFCNSTKTILYTTFQSKDLVFLLQQKVPKVYSTCSAYTLLDTAMNLYCLMDINGLEVATQLTCFHHDAPTLLTADAPDKAVGTVHQQFVNGTWEPLASLTRSYDYKGRSTLL